MNSETISFRKWLTTGRLGTHLAKSQGRVAQSPIKLTQD